MIGAMIGDIIGSRFEWDNNRNKQFVLFTSKCFVTDDSIMTLAVAKSILDCKGDYSVLSEKAIANMRKIGRQYPNCGFGGSFGDWIFSDNPRPYNSYGNGAAMRVSPCGFVATSLEECKMLSRAVTEVTHNHPEGLKGAEATAVAIYLARTGFDKAQIGQYVKEHYYDINFTLDEIRQSYEFNETCQETVPQAIEAFLESNDFEDAIRNAISIGGDSDTLAAITGGIAEAYYGISPQLKSEMTSFLDDYLYFLFTQCKEIYKLGETK